MDEATTTVRFLAGGLMLLGAVVYDLRERRVPNPWWVPFAWLAGVLALGDLFDPHRDLRLLGLRYLVAAVVAGLAYALWRLRMFGGADAKGLIVLAVLAPWPPQATQAVQPALDALANGAAFMLAVPPAFLLANLAAGHARLPAALLGRRVSLATARRRHVWPMQVADPSAPGGLRWRYWQRAAPGRLDHELDALERAGATHVWVTPKVPFLLLVLLGWAAAWRWGNLLLWGAERLAGP